MDCGPGPRSSGPQCRRERTDARRHDEDGDADVDADANADVDVAVDVDADGDEGDKRGLLTRQED